MRVVGGCRRSGDTTFGVALLVACVLLTCPAAGWASSPWYEQYKGGARPAWKLARQGALRPAIAVCKKMRDRSTRALVQECFSAVFKEKEFQRRLRWVDTGGLRAPVDELRAHIRQMQRDYPGDPRLAEHAAAFEGDAAPAPAHAPVAPVARHSSGARAAASPAQGSRPAGSTPRSPTSPASRRVPPSRGNRGRGAGHQRRGSGRAHG